MLRIGEYRLVRIKEGRRGFTNIHMMFHHIPVGFVRIPLKEQLSDGMPYGGTGGATVQGWLGGPPSQNA